MKVVVAVSVRADIRYLMESSLWFQEISFAFETVYYDTKPVGTVQA